MFVSRVNALTGKAEWVLRDGGGAEHDRGDGDRDARDDHGSSSDDSDGDGGGDGDGTHADDAVHASMHLVRLHVHGPSSFLPPPPARAARAPSPIADPRQRQRRAPRGARDPQDMLNDEERNEVYRDVRLSAPAAGGGFGPLAPRRH